VRVLSVVVIKKNGMSSVTLERARVKREISTPVHSQPIAFVGVEDTVDEGTDGAILIGGIRLPPFKQPISIKSENHLLKNILLALTQSKTYRAKIKCFTIIDSLVVLEGGIKTLYRNSFDRAIWDAVTANSYHETRFCEPPSPMVIILDRMLTGQGKV